jgi:hypothetical protein
VYIRKVREPTVVTGVDCRHLRTTARGLANDLRMNALGFERRPAFGTSRPEVLGPGKLASERAPRGTVRET